MRPEGRDLALLHDMIRHAHMVVQLTADRTQDDYFEDFALRLAVERAVEIIGEAARHVSDPLRDAHPSIPWRLIVGQRHILAHDYGVLDHTIIWRVATVHVPVLTALLEPLMPTPPPDAPSPSKPL